MEEIEKNKENITRKEKRVGTYTFGAMLIFIGISVIIMTFTKLEFIKYIISLWPLFLIGLGLEILWLNSKSDVKVKIDFGSIVLMSIVLFFTGIFSFGNYFVNKVLYDSDVKQLIANECIEDKFYDVKYDEKINVNVKEKEKVNVIYKQTEDEEKSGYILAKFEYIVDDNTSWVEIINFNNRIYDENIVDFNSSTLNIKELPNYIKTINITVCTNNIENINYDGEIK